VYGYLRAQAADEFALSVWRQEITAFCQHQGYRLETIFLDRRVPSDQVMRPGFGGLLGVLALKDTHGVVLLSSEHLSEDPNAYLVLQANIRAADAQMIVIHEQPS
jgi:hypothetical protein